MALGPLDLEEISKRIDEIVKARASKRETLRAQIERFDALGKDLTRLEEFASALIRLDPTVLGGVEKRNLLVNCLAGQSYTAARTKLAQAQAKVRVAFGRMSRDTVNVGVTGRARMGKSTLLQAITGLGEDQIPTGDDIPVTAVGSRVAHVPDSVPPHADLEFYSYEEFRDNILAAYFDALKLPGLPGSLGEFIEAPKPVKTVLLHEEATLARLQHIYDRRSDYVRLFELRKLRLDDLSKLRPYVAYPKHREPAPEYYHAVKSAVVRCTFPQGVNRLVVMDLPGLGEVDPTAERHHVEKLQNEVDVVLFVKRPTPATAFWDKQDDKVLELLGDAKGDVTSTDDFFFLTINANDKDPAERSRKDALLGEIAAKKSRSRRLEANGSQATSVMHRVVSPVLDHLAKCLPDMDRQVLDKAQLTVRETQDALKPFVATLRGLLTQSLNALSQTDREAEKLSMGLLENIAVKLQELTRRLDPGVVAPTIPPPPPPAPPPADSKKKKEETPPPPAPVVPAPTRAAPDEYRKAIEAAASVAKSMIDSAKKDEFVDQFARHYAFDTSPAAYVLSVYNETRVAVDRSICKYDDFLATQVQRTWRSVMNAMLETDLRHAIGGGQDSDEVDLEVGGSAPLVALRKLLDDMDGQCVAVISAIDELLKLQIRCESHFLHGYYLRLDDIRMMPRGPYGTEKEGKQLGDFPATQEGAAAAHKEYMERAAKAVDQIKDELLRQAHIPGQIIHATLCRFLDRFCRTKAAREQFAIMCQANKERIWPKLAKPAEARRDLEAAKSACDRVWHGLEPVGV